MRGTITAHHLWGTIEDAERDVFNFCKPVMKSADDRLALIQAALDGSSKFFLEAIPLPIRYSQRQRRNVPRQAVSHNSMLILSILLQSLVGGLLAHVLHSRVGFQMKPPLPFGIDQAADVDGRNRIKLLALTSIL